MKSCGWPSISETSVTSPLIVRDVPLKRRLFFDELILQLSKLCPRRIVFVHARQTKFKQLALNVVPGRGISLG
jgi:hypothetical protein